MCLLQRKLFSYQSNNAPDVIKFNKQVSKLPVKMTL